MRTDHLMVYLREGDGQSYGIIEGRGGRKSLVYTFDRYTILVNDIGGADSSIYIYIKRCIRTSRHVHMQFLGGHSPTSTFDFF